MFDGTECKKRDIEDIFRAEETRNYRPHCRFKPANMRRFGKICGIAWSLKVPNCLLRAKELGIPIPPYPNNGRVAAELRLRRAPLARYRHDD